MRPSRLLVVLLIAAGLASCAHAPAPPVDAAASPADLDSLAYGRLAPVVSPARMAAAPVPAPLPAAAPAPAPGLVMPASAVMPDLIGGDEPYTLDSGDRLRITVFGQEGLSNNYIVDANGRITMPFIGPVLARGCTTTQLSRVIADRLRRGYIREPHVAIEIEGYRPFFILGEVLAPGQYPYVPNMTVETAVAIAGGYTPRAYRSNAEISRSGGGITARQKVPTITPVRPGDTVTISERWF